MRAKKLEFAIRVYELEGVVTELCAEGIAGLTTTEMVSYARGVFETIRYRGAERRIDLLPRIRLEIVTYDHLVERLIMAIRRAATMETSEEDLILVSDVLHAVRIRTGEIDEAAIG